MKQKTCVKRKANPANRRLEGKPLFRQPRTDYHLHPDYSIDAEPLPIMDYCRRAVELGLTEICFTTHAELDPVRKEIDNYVIFRGKTHPVRDKRWLDGYFSEIEAARDRLRGTGLRVKAGVEIGYDLGLEKEIESLLEGYPFDYVLCAVHCLDHVAISSMDESPRYFRHRPLHRLLEDYFKVLHSGVRTGLFHCVAHLDLYRRYGLHYYGPPILTEQRSALEPLLKDLAACGMGLEINTSGLRRGLRTFHPSREIVAMAVEAGVSIFTVGSDAHRLEELGSGIDEALQLLDEFGLQNHVFSGGRPVPAVEELVPAGKKSRR